MLDILSDGFGKAINKLKGVATLTEENVQSAMDEIRRSLLEADVEYGVTKAFLSRVKEQALGQTVNLKAGKGDDRVKVSAGDHFVRICQKELENLMGPVDTSLQFPVNKPGIIMMVGLQGSGKTTSTGKLTKYLVEQHKRKPLLVAADIYRPAAVEQLRVLGGKLGIEVFHIEGANPVEISRQSVAEAYRRNCDTILIDTAGRLTIDDDLMKELDDIKSAVSPDNILLVCDAMMGQDAVTTAKAFNDRLNLSGVVITKLDGDARGGAALSIKEVTGKPIKFLGMGEDLQRLEEFRPEGLASRILGMGDVIGLMKDFEREHKGDMEADALKMLQGQFTFDDFYNQISMIQRMGPLKDIIAKMPIGNMIPKDLPIDDRQLAKVGYMINSMTKKERINPDIFNESRVRRVAKGSGRSPKEVSELLNQFKMIRNMMGNVGKNLGLFGKIPGLGGLGQLNQMRKMAQSMMSGGGGFPGGMGGMGGLGDMLGGGAGGAKRQVVDREKLKKLRKAEKSARKKNRKR